MEKNLLSVCFWKNKCVRDGCEDSNLKFCLYFSTENDFVGMEGATFCI